MIRTHALIWAMLVAAAVGVLFYTGHQAQELEAELEARHRAVIAEREAIRILHAEWAYLNEPGRLRELARRHTPLGPAMPVQIIADIDEIPAVLPGIGALPGVPLPPRRPQQPGPMASADPESAPAASASTPSAAPTIAPPRAPVVARSRPQSPTSDDSLHALLASFRAEQSTAQAGQGQ